MQHTHTKELHAESIRAIVCLLNSHSSVTVKTSAHPVTQSYLLSRITQDPALKRPLLFLAQDEYTKLSVFRLLSVWNKGAKHSVNAYIEPTPAALTALNAGKPCVLIATERELSDTVPSKQALAKHTITIMSGQELSKEELLSRLVSAGYSPERSAVAPGTIASRGSIVDIYPPESSCAFRVDFFDNQIDSIKTLVPGKTKATAAKNAVIVPYSLAHIPHTARLSEVAADAKKLSCEPFPLHPDAIVSFSGQESAELAALAQPNAARRKKSSQTFSFLKRLKNGEYVVHLDHGVAVFGGMVEQQVDGLTREYFKLQYAEGDTLFLPVTMAEKMEKYVGDPNPTLGRLSGGSWQKTVAKISAETLSHARELLNTHARRQLVRAYDVPRDKKIERSLAASFPYEETNDQKMVIEAVYEDLASPTPMDRLVCGDVGFGKTEVAVRATAKAALAGLQVAVLSPTTILSQQHVDTFNDRLQKTPITVASLSRFQSKQEQQEAIRRIAAGTVDVVVGTHRLLSGDVQFKNLGLIIIDEEQRFGVRHKEHLKKLRSQAHVLTLTATPIPRTLHLGLSGVREISTIATPPEGRKPIETFIEPHNDKRIKEIIEKEIARKGQVYYLYNNVETMHVKLGQLEELVPRVRFGILHGQLPEHQIADVMHRFDKGKLDVLVCSTIIENGLDLPNVNTLIVDNAVQFGLSQLHQIRGRIGRGRRQAYAYFFFLRQKLTGEAGKRLEALEQANKLGAGFELAQRDMEIRGIGNVLGKAQHGHVKSIGLGLYVRLLNRAVAEIKSGETLEAIADISIDLPIEARIPQFFEPHKEKRIERYHEWALIDDLDELKETKAQLLTEGALPHALENLFYIFKLKILGRNAQITSIDTTFTSPVSSEQYIILKTEQPIDPKQFARMLDICKYWQYATDEIKVEKEKLGKDWMKNLEKSIHALTINGVHA